MKLRSVVLFAAGVATGLAIARKFSEDDDSIVHGPQQAQSGNPMLRADLGPDRDAVRSRHRSQPRCDPASTGRDPRPDG